uniref:Ig-like domain-containing protein n=1 Tax=Electrophorus electricus TaxID=8005 RepID=A0A4W4E1F1_ELEEL
TQMAEPGVDVTMWCQHSLHGSGSIFWIKQTSNSVPQCVACKNHKSKNCYFFTPNNRTVMSVNDKNASLTITVVDPTDSGLYYCSLLLNDKITFSNTTYLHVKEKTQRHEADIVSYAALHFSNKKSYRTHRPAEVMDPHVLYSSIQH